MNRPHSYAQQDHKWNVRYTLPGEPKPLKANFGDDAIAAEQFAAQHEGSRLFLGNTKWMNGGHQSKHSPGEFLIKEATA